VEKDRPVASIVTSNAHSEAVTQPYVPLRVFSSFTMLEGAMEPKTVAERAAKLGFPAIAVTDSTGLYALMPFSDACMD
jgi:DNA polymerase-3 subunit alpha